MPKLPNLTNPIAAIRHHLGMKVTEFAQFVGHGKAMIQQVEAGRKPAGGELAEKIAIKTGIPPELILKRRFSSADRAELAKWSRLRGNPSGVDALDPILSALYQFPLLIATIVLLKKATPHSREIVETSLHRELIRLIDRYGVDLNEVNLVAEKIKEELDADGKTLDHPIAKIGMKIANAKWYKDIMAPKGESA